MFSHRVSLTFQVHSLALEFPMKNERKHRYILFLCNDLDSHRLDFYGSAEW